MEIHISFLQANVPLSKVLLSMGVVGSRPQGGMHSERPEPRAPEGTQAQVGTKQAICTEAGRPVPETSDTTYEGGDTSDILRHLLWSLYSPD